LLVAFKYHSSLLIFHFHYYDPEQRVSLGGLTSIVTLELNKLGGIVEKPISAMSSLERWPVFIKYYTDEGRQGLLEGILREEEAIAMAAQSAILKLAQLF
jgi:hypothetical protein